jgi:TPR repeat protein
MLKIGALSLVLLVSSGCMMHGYNLKTGIENFQVQNYRQSFIRLLPEAKAGQPDAQYAVGYMYYYGQGVIENRKKAFYWIERAANGGQPDAVRAIKILREGKSL